MKTLLYDAKAIRTVMIGLLARREHAALELQQKLVKRGASRALINDVLSELQRDGLQSEERFCEALLRTRTQQGYGWLHIRAELQKKGVLHDVMMSARQAMAIDWQHVALTALEKRFSEGLDATPEQLLRYLCRRGFLYEDAKAWVSAFRGRK